MREQTSRDSGTLALALISGISINGTFDALFSSIVTFSVFPLIALVLAVYCLHLRYQQSDMPSGMPTLSAACFLLGLLAYSTIIRVEHPELGSNFLPLLICVGLVFWIGFKLKARKASHI